MKKNVLFLTVVFILFFKDATQSQPYNYYLNIPVTQFGNPIVPVANAWTGGFDAPAFSQIDLNGDGIKDLFVFEKQGSTSYNYRYTTYINQGTPNQVDYVYAPQYKEKFPKLMHDWVLLVDYDCDGKEDIFTYTYAGGMAVYHNDYDAAGLKFHLEYSLVNTVYYGFPANLFVPANSQPALVDVDNDDDLDVLCFASTSYLVEYHQNLAEENFGRCDTLVFNMATPCWGHFGLTGDTACTAVFNVNCRVADYKPPTDANRLDNLHSGFCAISADMDGDGDKEFINGDINCYYLQYFTNGGTLLNANMISVDTMYPSLHPTGTPPAYLGYPQLGPHYFDADNDGNKDLIVAPCAQNSKNFNNVLFYKNTSNNSINDFTYIKNSLFVDNMIEIGSGANVCVTDMDGDGLQDIIMGNFIYKDQILANDHPAASYYRNTGTPTAPSFNLMTTDFANLSTTLGAGGLVHAFFPTFGDLDNDGDKDMIVGTDDGYLDYFTNNNGNYILTQVHMLAANGSVIYNGSYATPCIVDLNRDGRLDLVIGEKLGNLNYFQNTGTILNHAFTFMTGTLGGVNVTKLGQDIYGYSTPFFYDSLGNYRLMVGSLSGFVYRYDNIDNNIMGGFNLVDSMFFYEPFRSSVSGADINGDGVIDFLVGNYAGGATWYTNNATVSVNEIAVQNNFFNIYPNPASDVVYIKFEKSNRHSITIADMIGNTVYSSTNNSITETINLSHWSNGMYICKVVKDGVVANEKFIVRH